MKATIKPDRDVILLEKVTDTDDKSAKGALDSAFKMARLIAAHDPDSETAEQLKAINSLFTELRGYPKNDGYSIRLSVEQVVLATMAASLMAEHDSAKEYHGIAAKQLNVVQERIFEETVDTALRAADHPSKTASAPWGEEPEDPTFYV